MTAVRRLSQKRGRTDMAKIQPQIERVLVHGRPIAEIDRATLEREVALLQQAKRNLEDTIRLHNLMWSQAATVPTHAAETGSRTA